MSDFEHALLLAISCLFKNQNKSLRDTYTHHEMMSYLSNGGRRTHRVGVWWNLYFECFFIAICLPNLAVAQSRDGQVSGDLAPQTELEVGNSEASANLQLDFCLGRWRQGVHDAWSCFVGIPAETNAGRMARGTLERADAHYSLALEHLNEHRDSLARIEIQQGMAIGPMDPHYYFDLAEIYWDRGIQSRAVAYCGRYFAFMNQRRETVDENALQRCTTIIMGDQPDPGPQAPSTQSSEQTGWSISMIVLSFLLGSLPIVAIFVLIYYRNGWTLEELIQESPDLHPRIAYAISCLRHELLKHRLGALGDVVRALRSHEGLTERQLGYLCDRLYGGESLSGLWRIYIETFDRLAGRRLFLDRRDREFRRAWTAVRNLENLRDRFKDLDSSVASRLDTLRLQIQGFDQHLKWLSERLRRTSIDGKMLREAVFSVQSEPRAAEVRVDEIRFGEPPPDVHVEVFRSDLMIVLRNLVRNAIMALGNQDNERRVLYLDVDIRTEPTGDESVLIKVLDTSAEKITTEDIYGRRFDRGLGLVAAAMTRYDGSVFVESGHGDYTKAVVVRFFRALGEDT